jgi:predicted enzyme related to lactoylglutathione lyase
MSVLGFTLLYVESPAKSVAFYEKIFGRPPLESSANFAMFQAAPGITLGLWARHDVQPKPLAVAGSSELGFPLPTKDDVNALAADWQKKGVEIVQRPMQMDFGWTFTAVDPDGHRLRVFAPGA